MWCFVQRLRLHSMFIVSDLMTFCSMSQICKVSDKDPRPSCLDHVVWYVINQATIAVQAFMAFAISTPLQEYFSFICSAIIFWASPLRSSSWRRLLLSGSPSNLSPIESSWSWLAEMFGCSWQIWGRNVKAAVSLTFKLLSNSKNTEKKGEAQTHRHSLPPQSICHTPECCYSDIHSIIQLLEYKIHTANTTSWPVCDLKSEQYRCRSPFSRTNVSSPIPIP